MSPGHAFRLKATEFVARLKKSTDPTFRVEHARMAAAYRRLADNADRRVVKDAAGEAPPAQKTVTR